MTTYVNSSASPPGFCHDGNACYTSSDPLKAGQKFCGTAGTKCPPDAPVGEGDYRTYLAYRWLDADGDGLTDLVAAVHGSIDRYDIERGNLPTPASGINEPFPFAGGSWPACPGAQSQVDLCRDVGTLLDGARTCDGTGPCIVDWEEVSTVLGSSTAYGCFDVMARQGGGGGDPSIKKQAPYTRCEGLYPWFIFRNGGNGTLATVPIVKYQPVPLESDGGDSSLYSSGLQSQNHGVFDFDGDGVLDGVVHGKELATNPNPDAWYVWLGDGTGGIGPKRYYVPTRKAHTTLSNFQTVDAQNRISASIGDQGEPLSLHLGTVDLNGDGLSDHYLVATDSAPQPQPTYANIAMNVGTMFEIMGPPPGLGAINTPMGVFPTTQTTASVNRQNGAVMSGDSKLVNRLQDVDNDGRVDIVKWDGSNASVFFNLGGQFLPAGTSFPGVNGSARRQIRADSNIAAGIEDLKWELTSDVLDLDGNGVSEGVRASTGSPSGLIRNLPAASPPRLLKKITNGRGLSTVITYASMHEDAPEASRTVKQSPAELWSDPGGGPKATPAQLWVTKSIRVEDTFNAPGSQTVTSYKYANPRHGKDDQGQYGFRGFETVTTTSHSGARTEETFAYDVDWSGRLKKSVVFSAETPSSPTTVDVTTHTPYTSLFAGLTTFHATRLEHYVCADAQTESACTTAPVYYTRSDSTFTPKGSTGTYAAPLLYVQSATRVQHQTSPADKDRASSTSYVLAADGSTYCLRPTVTESQVQTAGVMVTFAKTEAAWDAGTAYARKLSETVWFDAATSSTTTYNFEAATGNLLSVTTPRGHTTSYEYDARKLFVAFDNTPFYTHDIEYSYEYGTGVKLETRGPNWAPCSQTNPPSCGTTILRQTSRVVVDGLGRPLETWATVNIDANTYDVRKVGIASYVDTATSTVPTSVTTQSALKQNPVTGEISYAAGRTDYDGHGRPQRITQYAQGSAGPSANDNVTVYAYRLDGTLQTVWLQDPTATSALLVPYTYTFDSLGRPTGITRPGSPSTGAATSYKAIAGTGVYTDVVEVTTTGKKAQLRRTLDADGRLVKVEEKTQESGGLPSAWAATLYEHDAAGNVAKITDAEGKITLLGHDWAGHRLFIDRGNGRKWEYTYDLGGNVSTEKSPHATACSPQPTCQAFYTTGLVYDAGERLVTRNIAPRDLSGPDIDLFGAAQETYRYDWGSLMDRNERGRMTQWAAIGLDSQTRQNQIFADDAQGNRLYNWAWLNSAGYNLTRSLAHTYTLGGAVQRTSYNESVAGDWVQTVADVGYDARGLPSTVSVSVDGGLTFLPTIIDTRNIAGLVTKRRADYPSSPTPPMAFIESVWTYDVLGRVLTQTVNKGTPGTTRVARQTLTYFGNDDVNTLRTDLGTGTGQTQTFTYDYRHQLTNVAASTHFGGTYTFGNAGRFTRAQITRGGSGRPNNDIVPRDVFYKYASTDPELVTSLNTGSASGPAFMTYTYDLAGNMLTKVEASTGNRWEYLYDGSDQLRRATKKSSTNAVLGSEEYWYDYSGNRSHLVTRNGSGTITELVWFHEGVEAHYGPPSAPSVTFAYAHTPMMRVKRASDLSTTREYQFHGLASSLLAAVDSSGTNNVIFNYAPFGEVIEAQQASGMLAQHKRRLNDKQQDDLTGLFYYGARYYDRTLMGWTQVDPLYLRVPDLGKQSTPRRSNLGVFSLNNPVRYMDPDGRDANVNALAGYRSEGENMDRDRAKNVMSEGGYVGGCANFTSQCPLIPYAAGGSGSMGPLTSRNACDGIHGVCEKPTQVEDLEAVFDPGVQLDNASRTLVPSEEAIQGAIDTIKDVSPGLGTYRSFSRGEYLMGAIGAVGDATLVGGWLSRAFSLGARAAKSTGTTFEILNGVRRAKAAELAGLKAIEAEIQIAGRQAVKASIAIEALRSPKAVIDTAGPGLNRWMDTLRRTFQGSKPPPITVQPGSRGTPIRDVVVE